ncbi:MAG: thiamine-phosphate kinase [Candidatus Ancillula sp.]|jgi:thiamine-monophosphate kinase|nr:thiamine-phosphate kinase [Candidatus Ancillula sp.]
MRSEDDLVAVLRDTFLPTLTGEILLGVGDDCAIIDAHSPYVTSTDLLVEGSHFYTNWLTPEDIARRTFMQNVADILAMGARPVAIVVGLVLPLEDIRTPDFSSHDSASFVTVSRFEWTLRFANALRDIAIENDVAVVGGDITVGRAAEQCLMLSGTVYGDLDGNAPVLRSGAKAGDILALSGEVGLSNAGYNLLKAGIHTGRIPFEEKAISRYKTPLPPFSSAKYARQLGANAMLDVSDGLYQDAMRIAKASDVSIELFARENINGINDDSEVSANQYYFGGEDHGLLASFDAKTFSEATSTFGFTPIGKVHVKGDAPVFGSEIDTLEKRGWDHLAHKDKESSYV